MHSRLSTNFEAFLDDVAGDAIVVGDFNPHDSGWYSGLSDSRGEALIGAIEGSEFAILNEDFPTRHASNGSSSPDVSLISAHLSNLFSWSVPHLVNNSFSSTILNSDHLPILLSFDDPNHQQELNNIRTQRSYINLRRADWDKFTSELELLIPQAPPPTCAKGERILCDAIHTAAKHNIPAGYRKNFVPNLPPEAVPIRDQRDSLRASNPAHPDLPGLERQLRDVCDKAAHEAFNQELADTAFQTNSPRFANLC